MSRTTAEDQLRFLVSCIRHSNNGKVDFQAVAADCEIVSKGAAAKRFERLLKQYNLHESSNNNEAKPGPLAKKKTKASIEKAAEAKRRKIEGTPTKEEPVQDDDYDVKPSLLKHEPWDQQSQPAPIDAGAFTPYMSHESTLAPALPLFPQPMSSPSPVSMASPMPYLTPQHMQQQSMYSPAQRTPTPFHPVSDRGSNFAISSQQQLFSANRQPYIFKQEEPSPCHAPTPRTERYLPTGLYSYQSSPVFNGFTYNQPARTEMQLQSAQLSPTQEQPEQPEQHHIVPLPPQEVAWSGDTNADMGSRGVEEGTAPANSIIIAD